METTPDRLPRRAVEAWEEIPVGILPPGKTYVIQSGDDGRKTYAFDPVPHDPKPRKTKPHDRNRNPKQAAGATG